jgi:hypothetical protein
VRSRDLPAFRYVAIQPARIEARQRLGPASYLHDFLVDHQTDAAGNVNYGKPFGYAWIRSRWLNAPTIRTLKRHMARLRQRGEIDVKVMGFGAGMKVRVLNSAKWSRPQVIPRNAVQLAFGATVSQIHKGTKVAPNGGQKWPRKELGSRTEEKTRAHDARAASHTFRKEQKAKRLIREISSVHEVYAGLGPGDPGAVERRDSKLDQLYGQLRTMGYTDGEDERAGVRSAIAEMAKRKAFG